jgi:hypothetical protein
MLNLDGSCGGKFNRNNLYPSCLAKLATLSLEPAYSKEGQNYRHGVPVCPEKKEIDQGAQ